MPRREIQNEQEHVAIGRKSLRRKDDEQESEAKRENRIGLITAILRHYITCLESKRGSVHQERSR
jgi:hypothetical protein